jgi:hypothetical protein
MLAVDAALKAKALELAWGVRAKQVRRNFNTKIPSREKLGIATVEHQIYKDSMHQAAVQTTGIQAIDCSQKSLDKFVKWQPHPASIMGSLRSNKRLRRPNQCNTCRLYYVKGYILSLLLAFWKDPVRSALVAKGSGTNPGAQPSRPIATMLW